MTVTDQQKLIILCKLGKIEFDDETGKYTFSPKKGLSAAFNLKSGWHSTSLTLTGLATNCFSNLVSERCER